MSVRPLKKKSFSLIENGWLLFHGLSTLEYGDMQEEEWMNEYMEAWRDVGLEGMLLRVNV